MAVLVQPLASVPITVYVTVLPGLAVTLSPVVADKPEAGDQAKEGAPAAVNAIGTPPGLQINPELGDTVTVGNSLTVTETLDVQLLPHASETVQVNV